jgi:hypothetical protein
MVLPNYNWSFMVEPVAGLEREIPAAIYLYSTYI